jgi:hypothetical protein
MAALEWDVRVIGPENAGVFMAADEDDVQVNS